MYYRVVKNILLFLMLYLLSANTAFAQRDHLCLYSKDNTADKSWSLDVVRKITFTQTDVAVYLWADDAAYNVPYSNFRKFTFEGNKTVAVTGITLNKTTATLTEGETLALSATVSPDNATDKTVTWTSSDASVASVSGGTVTALKAGKATIIASCGDKAATCEVTIKAKVTSVTGITLDKTTAEILEGETVTLTATVIPSDATDQTIVWTSSDESVAKVISGVVIGVKSGKATIIASCGGKAATCEVTVKPKMISVTSITLDKTRAEMTEGEILTLTADVAPEDATDKTLIWTSSDEAVATVKDGVVTAVKLGRATITAASTSNPSVSATCEVVVFSATGIGSVESDKNEKHDIYNLNGQRVTTMRKGGIYIVNGRKVLAK